MYVLEREPGKQETTRWREHRNKKKKRGGREYGRWYSIPSCTVRTSFLPRMREAPWAVDGAGREA